jgi:YHS domain-containing protein
MLVTVNLMLLSKHSIIEILPPFNGAKKPLRAFKRFGLARSGQSGYNPGMAYQDAESTPKAESTSDSRPHLVCGRVITNDPAYCNPALYQDQVIYFCTEFCLDAFRFDPDRFYAAHSRNRAAKTGG